MVKGLEVNPYEEALSDLSMFHMEKSEYIVEGLADGRWNMLVYCSSRGWDPKYFKILTEQ